jgi:hypothetical protein
LKIDPDSMAARQEIWELLELSDFLSTESFVSINIDKNKVRLIWVSYREWEFLYPYPELRETLPAAPTVIFLNWWDHPPATN